MHKKKIQTLIAAGVLSVGIIGGTLAWFTSQDSLTNIFNTGSVTDPGDGLDAGIDVEENFPGSKPDPDGSGSNIYEKPVLPGGTMTKEAWIESKANYNQIVRARVVKNFVDPTSKKVVTHYYKAADGSIKYGTGTESGSELLNLSYIQLGDNLNDNSSAPTGWTVQLNGTADTSASVETNWYYYNERITPHTDPHSTCTTTDLLKTVTLSSEAGNEYKNLRFDVQIEGQSIQSTNGAINDTSVWDNVPGSIKDLDETKSPSTK